MDCKGTIFDIKQFSVHDGPGIRTTVFFKGCPLKCAWCHNPEGISSQTEIMVFSDRCLSGCRDCLTACPLGALFKRGKTIRLDRALCDGCGACARACPAEALQSIGRLVTAADVMAEIAKDAQFYAESGGGVTFSGGEPMLQHRFLGVLLTECRGQGLRTAVDTSGMADYPQFEAILPLVDLFLFDLKTLDDDRHRRLAGASNRLPLANLRRLSRAGAPLALRIPIVPGLNDAEGELERLAAFCASLPRRHPVHLLPYHRNYTGKARRLGRPDAMAGARTRPASEMGPVKEIFAKKGLKVGIGG
jgi:pyruvate formate lyase activating enzyme